MNHVLHLVRAKVMRVGGLDYKAVPEMQLYISILVNILSDRMVFFFFLIQVVYFTFKIIKNSIF